MNDFVAGHLPFWAVNHTLSLLAWACVGRSLLGAFVPAESPNYIWRGFRMLTDWAVRLAGWLVPSYIAPRFLPLGAFCWLMALRWLIGLSFIGAGLAPRITPPRPETMSNETAFVMTVGACLLHGLISPAVLYVAFFHPVWMPEMLPPTAEFVFYGASLIVSTGTLLLAALPAALAERAGASLDTAMRVWLAAAALLAGTGVLARMG